MVDKVSAGPSKIWRVVLVLSLALNLAIVGLVAGFSYRSSVNGKPPQRYEVGLGPLGQALTREQRREIGEKLRGNQDVRRQSHRETIRIMNQIAEIVRTEPLDRGALQSVLGTGSQRLEDLQNAALEALLAQIEEMDADERLEFAARIDEISKRRRPN